MDFLEIISFLDTTADKLEAFWDINILSSIANQRVPDFIMSGRGTLLRSDIHILWTQWFIESICDPGIFANSNKGYAYILNIVKKRVPIIFPGVTKDEQNKITKYIARLVEKEVQRRTDRNRITIGLETRKMLWDIQKPEPRCWICGYKFTTWSENKFLGYPNYKDAPLPQFVDQMTLHGLIERDISIEVDHIVPFSKGGYEEDNLRLTCGWCNSHKGDRVSLYDVGLKPRTLDHPKLKKQSIPHPFWIVRLLSVRKCCENEGGCEHKIGSVQLTVFPRYSEGAMNPTNLRVVCFEHDSFGSNRFVSRTVAEQVR